MRDRVQIAPVVRLEDQNQAREAADGKRPQYIPLPRLGGDYFADLDGITTVAKTALLAYERIRGIETDKEVREFAFSVARRFGRFAYPDDVVECLRPLVTALQSKARRETSPLGKALSSVHSFRVQCEDWTSTPYELTLIVVMEPEVVPSDLDELAEPDDLPALGIETPAKRIQTYAEYLNGGARTPAQRYFGWQHLIDAWAQQCEEAAVRLNLTEVVDSVTAELVALDEFPLSRVLRTESLDLDYISDSRKAIS